MKLSVAHGHNGCAHHDRERGASLVIVLAIMVVGAFTIAALIIYAQTSVRAAQAYRLRTERVQAASDAVDLAIAEIRPDRSKGVAGSTTVTVTYGGATGTCDAEAGSGEADPVGGFADRTVSCVGKYSDRQLVETRVQMLDRNGDEPGAEIQVLDRNVSD